MAGEITLKGVVGAKTKTGKAFVLEGTKDWYSAFKASMLNGIERGDTVEFTYVKNGAFNNLRTITKVEVEKVTPAPVVSKVEETQTGGSSTTEWKPKTGGYGSAEDVLGKKIGCSFQCASTLLGGRLEDVETIAEMVTSLATLILDAMNRLQERH